MNDLPVASVTKALPGMDGDSLDCMAEVLACILWNHPDPTTRAQAGTLLERVIDAQEALER